MTAWRPVMPDVTWTEGWDAELLDGEEWPPRIVLRAWERNDKGERRIRAERVYVPEEPEP